MRRIRQGEHQNEEGEGSERVQHDCARLRVTACFASNATYCIKESERKAHSEACCS